MRSEEWWKGRTIHIAPQYPISIENRDQECFTGNMMLALPSIYRPRRGNAVKLRICASKHDLVCDYRLLRFLKLLRLLRFFECADRR